MVQRNRSVNGENRRVSPRTITEAIDPGARTAIRNSETEEQFIPDFKDGINLIDTTKATPTFVLVTADSLVDASFGIPALSALPALPDTKYPIGRVVFLTTDGKLYRNVAEAWVTAVATVDLTGVITTAQLADGSVTTIKVGTDAITTTKLADGAVTTTELGDSAVTAIKITDGTITTAKIGDSQVTTTKIGDGSITKAKIGTGLSAVEKVTSLPTLPDANYPQGYTVFLTTDGKLYRNTDSSTWVTAVAAVDLTGQITTTQITDSAVTTDKVNANAITAAKIAAGTITTTEIAADTILAGNIAAGAIATSELAAGAVTAAKIAADTITANEIAASAIGTAELLAGAVTAAKIAADTITANEIATDAITANEILAGAVTASELAVDSVIATKLAAVAIESGKYISSTSYVAGVSGWKIFADGTAEFNNVTVRGLLLASQAVFSEGTQLLTNGTFDVNTTGWTGSNCTLARDTTTKRTGAGSLKLTASSAADMYAYTPEGTSGFVVTPGAIYLSRAYRRTAVTGRMCSTRIRWYDSSGVFISESVGDLNGDPSTTWNSTSRSDIAPSTAAYASIRLYVAAPANTEVHFCDDAGFFRFSKTYGEYATASAGPLISIYGTTEFFYTGRDAETAGYLTAGQTEVSGVTDRPHMSLAAPRFTGASTAISLYGESVGNPSGAPPQMNFTADSHNFLPSNANKLRMVANVGGVEAPILPLLGYKSIRAGADSATYTTTSTNTAALVDVDAVNLVVTFTAPKSGKVIVELTGWNRNSGTRSQVFGLRSGSALVANSRGFANGGSSTVNNRSVWRTTITGLTAGTSYTWKWAWAVDGASTGSLYSGPIYGSLEMQIWGILE